MSAAFVNTIRFHDDYFKLPTDLVLVMTVLYLLIYRKCKYNYVSKILFVLFVILLHFVVVTIVSGLQFVNIEPRVWWFMQYWVLAAFYMILSYHINAYNLVHVFKIVGKFVVAVAFIFLILSVTTNMDIGIDRVIFPRPHGTLSEPAHLAFLLPGLIVISIIDKDWKIVGFAFTLALLTQSPTVYLTLAVVMILYAYSIIGLIGRSLILFMLLLLVFTYINISGEINLINSNNPFIHSVGRLNAGFLYFTDTSYSNARGVLVFDMFEIMKSNGYIALGVGFGGGVPLAESLNEGRTLDVTIWASFFVWFGLYGLVAFGLILFRVASKVSSNKHIFWILIGALFAGSINSGGVYMQFFILSLVFVSLGSHTKANSISRMVNN